MAEKGDFIVHGDDGKLYRVSREQLHAHPVKASDDASKHAAALRDLAEKTKKAAGGVQPFACVVAFAENTAANKASRS